MRTINNTGNPLVDLSGTAQANVVLTFKLVSSVSHQPVSAVWHTSTQKRIAALSKTATTDVNGEFTISLFETDTLEPPVVYQCSLSTDLSAPFYAPLPTNASSISFYDFYKSGVL